MQQPVEPTASADCLSLNRYNEAAASAMKDTDWEQVPGSEKLPYGTKSSMTEFLVFKEAQKEGLPPCPDLSSTHKEFAEPSAAAQTSHKSGQSDALKKPAAMKARRSVVQARPKATMTGNAWVRKGPSRSAQAIRIAKKGETLAVFGAENGWVSVGTQKSEGWVIASVLKQ
jgi:hypothetical protein